MGHDSIECSKAAFRGEESRTRGVGERRRRRRHYERQFTRCKPQARMRRGTAREGLETTDFGDAYVLKAMCGWRC